MKYMLLIYDDESGGPHDAGRKWTGSRASGGPTMPAHQRKSGVYVAGATP